MQATCPRLTHPDVLLDPYPALSWLRENDPVHWADDIHCWVITRHADVVPLLRDPRLSANRVPVMAQQFIGGNDTTPIRDYLRITNDMMLMKDGGDHHRLRVLGNRGFTPSALTEWEPRVKKVIDELLGKIQSPQFDIVADLAEPMPATVIAEMFNIPKADHGKFRTWADDNARFFGGSVSNPLEAGKAANEGAKELEKYFLWLHEERRKKPGNDLMSMFLAAEEAGRLSVAEVVNQCQLILIAGHVTTIDQLSNGVYALLSRPGEWERLVQSPELTKSAVEEMIRYDSAVTLVMRVATTDITVGDKNIKAGQLIFLAIAAANHDPAVFSDPEKFDITRVQNKHVGFGAGPHQCLGMSLARMELEASFKALLTRFPKLKLDSDRPAQRKCESLTFRGFSSLSVSCV